MIQNGITPVVSTYPFNSISLMVLATSENDTIVNKYLTIDDEIIYTTADDEIIYGLVKGYNSMFDTTTNMIIIVPIGSKVKRVSDSIEGLTIEISSDYGNNINNMYNAEDFQKHTNITNADGFNSISDTDYSISGTTTIELAPQSGVIDGLTFWTNEVQQIPIEAGESLPRIDLIVLEKNQAQTTTNIVVKKGTASTTPEAPSVSQTALGFYELPIMEVYVTASASSINISNITDLRNPITKEQVATNTTSITDIQTMLRGMIMAFAGATSNIPTGALYCDGREVSRTTYAALFAIIGTTFGAGDGSTTFNLPTAIDCVLYGAGYSSVWTNKENIALGAKNQSHSIKMTGVLRFYIHNTTFLSADCGGIFTPSQTGLVSSISANGFNYTDQITLLSLDTSLQVPTGSTFTPNAIGVNFCIFY